MPTYIIKPGVLAAFGLRRRNFKPESRNALICAGVSAKAIEQLFRVHASCEFEIDRATLKAYNSMIPRFEEWLTSDEYSEHKISHELPQWYAIIENIGKLEDRLNVREPISEGLRHKLDAWNAKKRRP